MDADEYQNRTELTEIYTNAVNNFTMLHNDKAIEEFLKISYCAGKLNGEAGEVAELVFKAFRDAEDPTVETLFNDERRAKLLLELGDTLWYVARLSDLLGWNLSYVMQCNNDKLQKRLDENKLTGDGDTR